MFVDHFRADGAKYDYFWEERWIRDEGYLKLVAEAVRSALQEAAVAPAAVGHFIEISVAAYHRRGNPRLQSQEERPSRYNRP